MYQKKMYKVLLIKFNNVYKSVLFLFGEPVGVAAVMAIPVS